MSPDDCTLRRAKPRDVPRILAFIRELAEYEQLLHEVRADERSLQRALFGDPPAASVLMAEWVGEPVGFALYHGMFSTFLGLEGLYLEDLYVRPAYRGRGVGTALLRALAREALDGGYCRLDWSCLDWNEPSRAYYRRLGARELDEWVRYRLDGDALARLAGTEEN